MFTGNSRGNPCGGEDLAPRAVSRARGITAWENLYVEKKFAWGIPCGKQPAWEKISCGGDDRLGGTRRGKIPSEIGQKSNIGNSTRKKSHIGKMPRRKNPTRKKLTRSITNYVGKMNAISQFVSTLGYMCCCLLCYSFQFWQK